MSKNQIILSNQDLLTVIINLERQDAANWESLSKYKNMKAFRRTSKKNRNLYEYMALGEMDLSPEIMIKTNTDLEYRNSWDTYSKSLKQIGKVNSNLITQDFNMSSSVDNGQSIDTSNDEEIELDLVYWRLCYPFPLADRDYLYVRYELELSASEIINLMSQLGKPESEISEFKNLIANNPNKTYSIAASVPSKLDKTHTSKQDPSSNPKKIVRVEEFLSICVVTSTNKGKQEDQADPNNCLLLTYLFDNPSGNIPSSVINWVAKTAMPKSLDTCKKAGDKYREWKSNN